MVVAKVSLATDVRSIARVIDGAAPRHTLTGILYLFALICKRFFIKNSLSDVEDYFVKILGTTARFYSFTIHHAMNVSGPQKLKDTLATSHYEGRLSSPKYDDHIIRLH